MATTGAVLDILEKNSTHKYYIQHSGYLANHLAHGVVALYRLGAEKTQIENYVDWYKVRLDSAESRGYIDQSHLSDELILRDKDADAILGNDTKYYELVNHYKSLLVRKYDGSIANFINEVYPRISGSLHTELLHPVIQIGYGIDVGSAQMVAEGFAYQHMYHFAPLSAIPDEYRTKELSKGSLTFVQILDMIRKDEQIKSMLRVATTNGVEPQRRLNRNHLKMTLSNEPIRSKIFQYVEALAYPEWFQKAHTQKNTSPKPPAKEDVLELMDCMIDEAIVLYSCCEYTNDFYLLHGVTGSWALKQIMLQMHDTELMLRYIKLFLSFILGLFIALGSPSVCLSSLDDTTADKASLDDYRDEVRKLTIDEHVYKLVHVCFVMGQLHTDVAKQRMYKRACNNVINVKGEFFMYDSAESKVVNVQK